MVILFEMRLNMASLFLRFLATYLEEILLMVHMSVSIEAAGLSTDGKCWYILGGSPPIIKASGGRYFNCPSSKSVFSGLHL